MPVIERRGERRSGEAVLAAASADYPDVLSLGSLLALRDVELDLPPFLKGCGTRPR
jgi:hypothetical protein